LSGKCRRCSHALWADAETGRCGCGLNFPKDDGDTCFLFNALDEEAFRKRAGRFGWQAQGVLFS